MNLQKDCSFFIGEIIEQICFGLYQIKFNLSNMIHIAAGYEVVLFSKEKRVWKWEGEAGRKEVSFNSLLEQKIVAAKLDENKCLTLKFENDLSLKFYCDVDGVGESCIVHHGSDFEVF